MPPALPPPNPDQNPLTSFFQSEAVGGALHASGFDIQEEMETLVRHFRDNDPQVSLRAHSRLRSVLNQVALASGLIQRQTAEATEIQEGRKVKVSFETARLISKVQENTDGIVNQDRPEFASTYFPANNDPTATRRSLVDSDAISINIDGANANGTSSGSDVVRPSNRKPDGSDWESGDSRDDIEDDNN
jgi:hypothetical protein